MLRTRLGGLAAIALMLAGSACDGDSGTGDGAMGEGGEAAFSGGPQGGRLARRLPCRGRSIRAPLAESGSTYDVDHAEIGTSFKAAVLFSDGVIDHTKFHASGDPTFSPVNEVSVDDVNGTLTIIDASPTVMNSSFDNSAPVVDMIRIGGTASPLFDHVLVTGAHCGFHTFGGVDTEPTIRNSVLEGMSYGVMAYTAKPKFENTNFIGNSADFGFCFGATADNAPTLAGNYYSAGTPSFDPSCFGIATPDAAPAAAELQVGPAGL